MSEMIERVAKAIMKAEDSVDEWDDIGPFWQGVYRKEARAAIEAMREPTVAMQRSGLEALDNHGDCPCDQLDVWFAMIDAALSAAKGET